MIRGNNNKALQDDIEFKSKERKTYYKPNPNEFKQGEGVFVVSENTYYKKIGVELTPLYSSGQSDTTIISNQENIVVSGEKASNSALVKVSSIVELATTEYITLADQYGEISLPLVIPKTFKSINTVFLNSIFSDGIGEKQTITGVIYLFKGNTVAIPTGITLYETAIKVNSDRQICIRLTERYNNDLMQSTEYKTISQKLSTSLYAKYQAGLLGVYLEVILNVEL